MRKFLAALIIVVSLCTPGQAEQEFTGAAVQKQTSIPAEKVEIEAFVGTLQIKNHESTKERNVLVHATGKEASLKQLYFEVDDGTLEINVGKKNTLKSNEITLTVTMPKDMPLELMMSDGTAEIAQCMAAKTELDIYGQATISVEKINGQLECGIHGNGTIVIDTLEGAADLKTNGSGKIHIKGGELVELKAIIKGNGTIRFDGATEQAELIAYGQGTIAVKEVTGVKEEEVYGRGKITAPMSAEISSK